MPEALPGPFHIEVPSHLAFVRPVRKMVEATLAAQGWSEDDIEDVALVTTEIVQNAIEHGSRGQGDERVQVICQAENDRLALTVEDPGTGQDPNAVVERDVTEPVPLDAARGRGLFLIGRLVGAFERTVLPGGGLRVHVVKESGTS